MAAKEAELAEEEAANNEAEAERSGDEPEVNRAREFLLRDYVDVYQQAIDGLTTQIEVA
jgi:hypothetical protein